MTDEDPAPDPLWDPFGLWRDLSRASGQWSAAGAPLGVPAAATPLQLLLDVVRSRLVGRRLSWRVGAAPLAFNIDDIAVAADSSLLAAGRVDEVTITASDLVWDTHAFTAARAVFHNVHTRSGRQLRIVSAPIDLYLHVSEEYFSARVGPRVPWLRVQITAAGDIQARLRARPDWGSVTVILEAQDHRILARPRRLNLGGHSWRLPARLWPISISLALPDDVRLTGVQVLPNAVELRIRVDERHLDYKDTIAFLSGGRGSVDVG